MVKLLFLSFRNPLEHSMVLERSADFVNAGEAIVVYRATRKSGEKVRNSPRLENLFIVADVGEFRTRSAATAPPPQEDRYGIHHRTFNKYFFPLWKNLCDTFFLVSNLTFIFFFNFLSLCSELSSRPFFEQWVLWVIVGNCLNSRLEFRTSWRTLIGK